MHHAHASPSATVPPGPQGRAPAGTSTPAPLLLPEPGCRHAVIALPAKKSHVRTVRRFVLAHLNRWGVTKEDRTTSTPAGGGLGGEGRVTRPSYPAVTTSPASPRRGRCSSSWV